MENRFLEEYIHLEKLLNDMYGTKHGVTKYIENMDDSSLDVKRSVGNWTTTYKRLKEIRWKRNQLVHENRIEYDDSDISWLISFYQSVMSCEDPLSMKHKLETKAANVEIDSQYYKTNISKAQNDVYVNGETDYSNVEKPSSRSFVFDVIIVLVIVMIILGILAFIGIKAYDIHSISDVLELF